MGGQGERRPKSTCFQGALSQLMVQKPARLGMMPLAAGQGQAQACPGTQDREQYRGGAQCPRVSISAGRQGPGKLRDPGAAGSGA